jgi:hypothetical protein
VSRLIIEISGNHDAITNSNIILSRVGLAMQDKQTSRDNRNEDPKEPEDANASVATEDDDDLSDEEVNNEAFDPNDTGELIDNEALKKGYSWKKLILTQTDALEWIDVAENYIPSSGNIKDKYVVNRCNYLGLELTQANKFRTMGVMQSHQYKIRTTLKDWFQRRSGRPVTKFIEFQSAVRQCKTLADAKKLAICLYVSFDFCDAFRRRMAKAVMKEHGLRFDPLVAEPVAVVPGDPNVKTRRKKTCFEKLVTQILTDQRKNINKMSLATCKLTFTNTRPSGVITDANEKKFRRQKCFYDW